MALEIAAAVATVRAVAAVAKEAGKIELYQKVLDLQQILLEAVAQNTDLAERNHSLSEMVRQLEAGLAQERESAAMVFDGQVYWKGQAGVLENGPYCPRCKDRDGRAGRMIDRGNGFTFCPSCDFSLSNNRLPYPELRLSPHDEGPIRRGGWQGR